VTGWLLTHGGDDPSVLSRRDRRTSAQYASGAGREFVTRGRRYDSAFLDTVRQVLKYLPDMAISNNVAYDHRESTRIWRPSARVPRFVNLIPRRGPGLMLVCAPDDEGRARDWCRGAAHALETFGLAPGADWQRTISRRGRVDDLRAPP